MHKGAELTARLSIPTSTYPLWSSEEWFAAACNGSRQADFIVTSDKDLLRLGNYDGILILRPVDFLQRGR